MTTIPHIPISEPFQIAYRKSSSSNPVLPHTHDGIEFYFTLTDLPDVLLNDTVSSVRAGSLIIIPPHYVHQLYNQKLTIYERFVVNLNLQWIDSVFRSDPGILSYASAAAEPMILPLSPAGIERLRTGFENYLSSHEDAVSSIASYAAFLQVLSILDSIITDTQKRSAGTRPQISASQKHVNSIISYINEHLTEPLTLDMIAGHFYMNKDYLGRLFKLHTHATIGHYIAIRRIALAETLLSQGMTVTEVQERLGFSSYAYFFRFFRKMTGISPSHYRANGLRP